MTNNSLKLLGPGLENVNNNIKIDFPDCINIKSAKDEKDIKEFLTAIITAANNNCINLINEYAAKQNENVSELIKKFTT